MSANSRSISGVAVGWRTDQHMHIFFFFVYVSSHILCKTCAVLIKRESVCIWFAYEVWTSSCEILEDAARQQAKGTGRDRSRQDVHSSHRSQKAMLQPCVHQHRREASVVESWRPPSEAPLSLWRVVWPFPHVRCRARLRQDEGWVSKCAHVCVCWLC